MCWIIGGERAAGCGGSASSAATTQTVPLRRPQSLSAPTISNYDVAFRSDRQRHVVTNLRTQAPKETRYYLTT